MQSWEDKFNVERAAFERLSATLEEVRGKLGAAEQTIRDLRVRLAASREECAKVADRFGESPENSYEGAAKQDMAKAIAAAIRKTC